MAQDGLEPALNGTEAQNRLQSCSVATPQTIDQGIEARLRIGAADGAGWPPA